MKMILEKLPYLPLKSITISSDWGNFCNLCRSRCGSNLDGKPIESLKFITELFHGHRQDAIAYFEAGGELSQSRSASSKIWYY
jgi:hypothetical protein